MNLSWTLPLRSSTFVNLYPYKLSPPLYTYIDWTHLTSRQDVPSIFSLIQMLNIWFCKVRQAKKIIVTTWICPIILALLRIVIMGRILPYCYEYELTGLTYPININMKLFSYFQEKELSYFYWRTEGEQISWWLSHVMQVTHTRIPYCD